MSLPIVLTDAGRSQMASGQPLIIDAVIVGSGAYTPLASQTVMQTPIKTITTISGATASSDTISVTIKDTSSDAYTVNEIGLRLSTGQLFAVMSQPAGGLLIKTALSWLMATFDAKFVNVDVSNISFGDASFAYAPATETTSGVVMLATTAEAKAGLNAVKSLTPKTAKELIIDGGTY